MQAIDYGGVPLVFASLGDDVTLHPHCVFVAPERIHLGSRVLVSEFTWIHAGVATVIGSFVHLSSHSSIAGGGACIVEDFVGLSAGARLVTGTELVGGEGLTNPTVPPAFRAVRRSFVHLRKHAFLGTNAVVHPGVTIGEGAVIGSGAVVTRDVEPWTINVGRPARATRARDHRRIQALEARLYESLGVTPLDPTPFLAFKREDVRLPTA
jgi:acetyltransferase-like isoleucine patch superfamily enzyme